MPIFQDDFGGGQDPPPTKPTTRPPTSPVNENVLVRKLSEDSIRTDLCEGPLRESLEEEPNMLAGDVLSGHGTTGFGTSDRGELIERLKRGESPTWLPNRNVGRMNDGRRTLADLLTRSSLSHCSKSIRRLPADRRPMVPIPRHYCQLLSC
jgi:hypothetical protein